MILSTLDTKRQAIKYFIISIFFLIFGVVYEAFSHNVFSNYMMWAFLIPLFLGFVPYMILYILNKKINIISLQLYNSCILTFTLGSIMKGILEIYGTTNVLMNVYLPVSITLLVLSIIVFVINILIKNN